MISLTWTVSNKAAQAAMYEIRAFLDYEAKKITREIPDRKDTATEGYVALRGLLQRLDNHCKAVK